MGAARWSREPHEKGLRAITQGERGYDLKKDGDVLARVRPLLNHPSRFDVIGWYWYGLGQNTCGSPVSTPEEAKAQAMAHYRSQEVTR